MKYKIVVDSGCDLTDEMKKNNSIEVVPLSLQLEDKVYIDDESLNINDYLVAMKECPESPKTACPSPDSFMKHYDGEESVFVVTLSHELSGSYNSAELAKSMYLEDHPDKFIHIFNSKSASVGETLIVLKIEELAKAGLNENEIVEKIEEMIEHTPTYFLIESLEHLAKAGRLKSYVAIIASLLAIKPIMGKTPEGSIRLVHKVRGYKKAFLKFVEVVGEEVSDFKDRILAIAHCNCIDRALEFKTLVLQKYNFKDIVIVEMKGVSTTYADQGGLVIAL